VLSAISTAVALASLLLVGKMATNVLPTESVAIFLLALLLADGVNLVSNLGLFAAAPKLIAELPAPAQRDALLASLLRGQLVPSLSLGAVLLLCALGVDALAACTGADSASLRTALLWAAPLSILGAYRDMLLAAFAGYNRYGAHTAASVVLSAGQAILVFLLIWVGEASVPRILLAVTLSQGAGVLLLLALAGPSAWMRGEPHGYARAARFSVPLYVNTLLNFLFQRIDTLLVTSLLGLHAAAIYEIAKRFPQVLSRVLNALLLPWLPMVTGVLASGDAPAAQRALRDVLCAITYLGYAGVLVAAPLAPLLVLLLASPEYLDAAPLLPGLMTGIHLAVQAGVFGQTLVAQGRPRAVTVGNVAQALCSVAGAWWLLPVYGLPAMGLAWCAGAGLSLAIQAAAVHRAGVPLPLRAYGMLHLVFGAALLVAWQAPAPYGAWLAAALFLLCGAPVAAPPVMRLLRRTR
jgi:O-antigen/teichoic acid export membrane protein